MLGAAPIAAHAQYVETYLPAVVPGFDKQQGVTVLSRLRPLYEEPGVRAGDFVIRSDLDEGIGYNSNIVGTNSGPSSAFLKTSPSIAAYSNWSRDRLGIALSLDNYTYFDASQQNRTDATASIGGGYTIGRSELTLAYSHQSLHETGTDIGAVASQTPVHYQVDEIRSDYTFDLGRLSLTPNLDVSNYTFDNATILGVNASQQYRNRVVALGGVTARYDLGGRHSALVVLQGVNSHYTDPLSGQVSNNSRSALALAGFDFQANGVFRYRLLAGVEVRDFQASQYGTRVAPIVEASVIWTPTGLTTVTGTASRTIEEAQSEGTAGYIYNNVRLVVDHEYLRNVLLQGRGGFQAAEFLQGGGTQTSFSVGGGITWLLNRHMRLSADYDFTDQHGTGNGGSAGLVGLGTPGSGAGSGVNNNGFVNGGVGGGVGPFGPSVLTTGSYSQSLFLLNLHLGL